MRKYFKNGLAYLRGVILRLYFAYSKNFVIEKKVRVFLSASFDISKGSKITLKESSKIREHAYISVRKGAHLILGKTATVGMDCKIVCHESIEIGDGTLLSPNVLIYDHDHKFNPLDGVSRKEFNSSPIIIGRNCWIGANTVILKGTKIGDNSIIGAGSIVKGVIPPRSKYIQRREIYK